ncbi:unnamed protein product [Darwinula stevensoni]|uniref:Uncharacterized protein n=1 Tax=Darwinula stevensoni TaxID=69355 RepID=A0A7R9AIJ8_9CRUS|nr:unnamed protein product [Darwinula stevensoni]CAG0906299.1 unnamed protein product [Darwinula stevensoni]
MKDAVLSVRTEEARRKGVSPTTLNSLSNHGRKTDTEKSKAFRYHKVLMKWDRDGSRRHIAAVTVLDPAVAVLHPATTVLDPTMDEELEDRLFLTEFHESETSRNLRREMRLLQETLARWMENK